MATETNYFLHSPAQSTTRYVQWYEKLLTTPGIDYGCILDKRVIPLHPGDLMAVVARPGAFQKQQLTDIYGYAPEDRNIGGANIKQIETDFAMLGVVWAPQVPAATLLVADLAFCNPVFLPVPDKGVLFYEELARTGASEKGQIYGQMGIDYGPEEYHGTITSLATS